MQFNLSEGYSRLATMTERILPRVNGRHRNKALAAARRNRPVELRTQGWTYEDIAAEMGCANRGTVHAIVRQALANQEVEFVGLYWQVEMDRLDRLLLSLKDRIDAGEVPTVREALRISNARVRLPQASAKATRRAALVRPCVRRVETLACSRDHEQGQAQDSEHQQGGGPGVACGPAVDHGSRQAAVPSRHPTAAQVAARIAADPGGGAVQPTDWTSRF